MKLKSRTLIASTIAIFALMASTPGWAGEITGGYGNAADKLLQDWASFKAESRNNTLKFTSSLSAGDLSQLQNGKLDFAILNAPLSDAELNRLNLQQYPFALSGVAIVVNLPNTMAGALRLDSSTLGKIFSGEISSWDDPAITALNPKHDLPAKPITIIHSDETSADYPVFNSYLNTINANWKAGDAAGRKRTWPNGSINTDDLSGRIAALKGTAYSIGYLPMQYMSQPSISAVHLMNKDGKFTSLSDTSILAAASKAEGDDGRYAGLTLINASGNASWPLSDFVFLVISNNRLNDEKISDLMSILSNGLKFGSLKPTLHNFVAIPDALSRSIAGRMETIASNSAASKPQSRGTADKAQEIARAKAAAEAQAERARAEAQASQEDRRNAEARKAKLQADELAREKAVREAKAAKQAADEAIRAAQAAKLEAERLAEKNRQIAKAEKEKADRERAAREQAEKEQAEKEKAIEMRNRKDEDPLEAYRRSVNQE